MLQRQTVFLLNPLILTKDEKQENASQEQIETSFLQVVALKCFLNEIICTYSGV